MMRTMAAFAALTAIVALPPLNAEAASQNRYDLKAATELVTRGHATAGDGKAIWRRDGTYTFTSNKGQKWNGRWRVVGDQICVAYTTGHSRCDEIRKLGNHWYLVTQWGEQYPLR